MAFTPEEISDFHHHGWIVREAVFNPQEVQSIAELAAALSRQDLQQDAASDLTDHTSDGQRVPRKLNSPFLRDPAFRTLALDARLRELVQQLTCKPPLLMADQIFLKPPRHGSAKPYHQDNAYFECEPAEDVITAWIALDDADEENGCLHYINGSHIGAILEHVALPHEPHNKAPASELINDAAETAACVRCGGVVFHHSRTLHRSPANHSDRWRRAYATHWGSADVRSTAGTVDRAYYNAWPDLYTAAESTVD